MKWIFGAVAGWAMVLLCATNAFAQSSVRILVGFPAGGAPDLVARAFAEALRQKDGTNVIVENRTGASGKIAIDALFAQPADGLTLAVIPSTIMVLLPLTIKSAHFDAAKDFTTVGNLAEYGFGVAAGPGLPVTDFTSFQTHVRQNKSPLNYGTPGPGTPQHFLGTQLRKDLGGDLVHVPYRGGAVAMGDLLGGHIPLIITTEQLLVPMHKDGKLKTLFVTSHVRNKQMPDVPTVREIGLPNLEAEDWFGLFMRKDAPPQIVDVWRKRLVDVLAMPAYQDAIKATGYVVPARQAEDFSKIIGNDAAAWAERVKISGFEVTD